MHETANKYKLPVHFFKAKLASYPFSIIYLSNVLNMSQNLPTMNSIYIFKKIIESAKTQKLNRKLQKCTQTLLVMLVKFRLSGCELQ